MMNLLRLAIGSLIVFAQPGLAEVLRCPTSEVIVRSRIADVSDLICSASERAAVQFQHCNLPPLNGPIRIDVTDVLPADCVGLYHCHQNWIEVLPPSAMRDLQKPEGNLAFLSEADYFQSVVVHELAHAAFDTVKCPFDSCVVANEYVAYTMQVMSLTDSARITFAENAGLDRRVSVVELSRLLLDLAPERFAARAWAHLQQRDDPCGFIGQIIGGSIVLDRERF